MQTPSINKQKNADVLTQTEQRVETERDGVTSRIFQLCSDAGQVSGRFVGEAAIGTAKVVAKTTLGVAQGIFQGLKGSNAPKTNNSI